MKNAIAVSMVAMLVFAASTLAQNAAPKQPRPKLVRIAEDTSVPNGLAKYNTSEGEVYISGLPANTAAYFTALKDVERVKRAKMNAGARASALKAAKDKAARLAVPVQIMAYDTGLTYSGVRTWKYAGPEHGKAARPSAPLPSSKAKKRPVVVQH